MPTPWDPSLGPKPTAWDTIGDAAQKSLLKSLRENSKDKRRGGLKLDKDIFEFENYIKTFERLNTELEKAYSSMSAMGLPFVKDGPMATGLAQVAKNTEAWFGSASKGITAYRTLSEELTGFNQLANSTSREARQLTIDLADQAATMKELGLNTRLFAQNLDLAIFTFNESADNVKRFNIELAEMADSLDMLPSVVSRNFQLIAKNMAFDLTNVKKEFMEFQKMANVTGIAAPQLAQQFGDKLDTISGASNQAAMLNQLLGTNKFSANQFLMTPPSERAKMIQKALKESPELQRSLNSENQMEQYYARKSIAESLGADVNFQRRFMETGDLKMLDDLASGKTPTPEEADPSKAGVAGAITASAAQVDKRLNTRLINFGGKAESVGEKLDLMKKAVIRTQLDLTDSILLHRRRIGLETRFRTPGQAPVPEQAGVLQNVTTGPIGAGMDLRKLGNRGAQMIAELAPGQSSEYFAAVNAGLVDDSQIQLVADAIQTYNLSPGTVNKERLQRLMQKQLQKVRQAAPGFFSKRTDVRSAFVPTKAGETMGLEAKMMGALKAAEEAGTMTANERALMEEMQKPTPNQAEIKRLREIVFPETAVTDPKVPITPVPKPRAPTGTDLTFLNNNQPGSQFANLGNPGPSVGRDLVLNFELPKSLKERRMKVKVPIEKFKLALAEHAIGGQGAAAGSLFGSSLNIEIEEIETT